MIKLAQYATKENFKPETFTVMVFIHLMCLFAPFCFSWEGVAALIIVKFLTGCLGITFCYHRLLTHRGLVANKYLTYLTALLGCFAWQGEPCEWVATHRIHHKETDKQNLDPHTPNDGFLWSHLLWVLFYHPKLKSQEQVRKLTIDFYDDPFFTFLRTNYIQLNIIFGGVLLGLGYLYGGIYYGYSFLIYGLFLRAILSLHSTWFVNSAAHVWGYQNYQSRDQSRNLWWVAALTWGEGWHNNHHNSARDCQHGHTFKNWFELDITYGVILIFKKLGLVKNLVLPKR